jgi:FolB domain-containing protein
MTEMLASVASPVEADVAVGGGADMIDVMGAAPGMIQAVVAAVGGRCGISAFAGDKQMQPNQIVVEAREIAAMGVGFIKVGLLPGGDTQALIAGLAEIALHVNLTAVFFGDAPPDLSLLPVLKRAGFQAAMLDTQDQPAPRLLDHFDVTRLLGFVGACHDAGLRAGLAGCLETPDIPRLLVLSPDVLGFSEALRGDSGAVDAGCVQAVRALIPSEGPKSGRGDVDYRLLAARSQGLVVPVEDGPIDLVFVDDLVLPVFIGAYARERNAPQNVRFSVTASVMGNNRATEDMRDVFSYDLITDGIRVLIGSGHIALVETLAERIAAMVLGHPRVTKVVVRVQKLDTGSGRVGVEIERVRKVASPSAFGAVRLSAVSPGV